jgi:hypothetical protein
MSQLINISNYEEFVMDYIDGTLDVIDRAHFEAFLLKHPEVALEVEEMMESDLNIVSIAEGLDANSLKISVTPVDGIDESNYEEAMALSVDSDLDPRLANSVQSFVDNNPKLAKDYKMYMAAKLSADHQLVYADKSRLKQPIPLFVFNPMVYRIAAAIAIILGITGLLNSIQNEMYVPRDGLSNYASLDVENIGSPVSKSVSNGTIDLVENASVANRIVQNIERLPIKEPGSKWKAAPVLDREQPSLAIAQTSILPDGMDRPIPAEELNLAQFVGKEFLGLSPDKTGTTKSLLKESAKKVIDQSDQIALNTVKADNNKKTFSLMAGTLEFKRVTYRSN